MGKFNFEDYRQAWETGPHWELKREFIENYQDMFEEERLLCLAQAYSNVVLMNCSYPDPVMRQISELSKPLQMRKKFQEVQNNNEAPTPKNENQRVAGKIKSIYGQAGRPFKQVKFCASTDPHESANYKELHQSSSEQFQNSNPLSISSQQSFQSSSDTCIIPSFDEKKEPQTSPNTDENLLFEKEKDEKIVSALGLPFIKNFVGMLEAVYGSKSKVNEIGGLFRVINRSKLRDSSRFEFNIDPDSPDHARLYVAKFIIQNCEIASKTASKKKEAKLLCARAAVDTLVRLSTLQISSSEVKSQKNLISQNRPSNHEIIDSMKLFCSNIVNRDRNKNEAAIVTLKTVASLLDMDSCISFDVISHQVSQFETEYYCKFCFKGIFISSGKAFKSDDAKNIAAKLGLKMLSNLPEYEIQNGELIKKQCSNSNHASASDASNSNLSRSFVEPPVKEPRFILNRTMYDLCLKDGFVLVEKEKYREDMQMYSRTIVFESASFNRKTFEYQFEDAPGTTPPLTKALLLIGGKVVGTGIGAGKEEAKVIACTNALNDLKKKYYTLKVKEEYVEGFIITPNQVFEGESFSSNVISESNIGCKMLKNMGWTGGGLGGKGIVEPIQATSKLSSSSGLGFEESKDRRNLQLFKKRLGAMLRDFCQSENYSDLVFSKDFTKEERKHIHQLAARFHLHTQSRGVGEERFLTIRQKYESLKLLIFLVNNGGSNSKFELIDDSGFSLQV